MIFWIPPTHIEFQQRKVDFGLEKFDQQFVSDLQSLGDLYDFDFNSDITRNKEDYHDPMHFSHKIGEIVYHEIFFNSPQYSRFTEGK